jgi:uncharacterized protein (TIGR03083 family)
MAVTVEDCLAAIAQHTHGLAEAARGNLGARVQHCGDWTVADLVHHLTEVHAFWDHVAATLPTGPPEDRPEEVRASDGELIETMLVGMETLVATLRVADQQAPCWTWGLEENVWFITRHQVQEAAVHHWDAADAAGQALGPDFLDDHLAADAVDEFLTHSVSNSRWPRPDAPPMGGPLGFCGCCGSGDESYDWLIRDGEPGTLAFEHRPDLVEPTDGHVAPADLLLWLYRRDPSGLSNFPHESDVRVRRFRTFTNTA